jgi:hypothetical protein
MPEKPSQVTCAECQQLWKDYGDASLKRVRAYGNLKLANLRSNSETMEMLAEAAALATQKLEEVKKKIQEHDAIRHTFQKPTHQTSDESVRLAEGPDSLPKRDGFGKSGE